MTPFPIALAGDAAETVRAREARDRAVARREPVLIVAEEGIDAAAIARDIHDASASSAHPFVIADCAAPGDDVETVLFGTRQRTAGPIEVLAPGAAFLRAAAGTVLLLGVTELPASAQRRLARLLRDGEARAARRVAARVNARIVASATPALAADVRDGRFRSDLYRRLRSVEIVVPPLRRRPEDFPVLVPLVARMAGERLGRRAPSFTSSALTVLASLPWRRNIEELEALVERLLRGVDAAVVKQEDVLAELSFEGAFARRSPVASLREARLRFEREYIEAVLEHHEWQMSAAARTLGIERANLYRKTRQLGIARAPRPRAHRRARRMA